MAVITVMEGQHWMALPTVSLNRWSDYHLMALQLTLSWQQVTLQETTLSLAIRQLPKRQD